MNKNKKYIVGVSILLVSLITIGISYAYWMLSLKQEDKNIVTSDCFKITFTGENDINLTNAYPMHDDELYTFYQNATPYHFTITNTCESHASGVINLETLSSTKKLADDYVDVILYDGTKNYLDIAKGKTENTDVYSKKGEGRIYNDINIYDYSLKSNPVNPEKILTDSITAYKLHEFTLSPLETKEYNLLEYMSPNTPPIDDVMNATFESKITITTSYKNMVVKNNKLRKREGCSMESGCTNTDVTRVFQDEYINNTTSIVFENTTVAPTTYVASFDESEAKDGSIMAYVVANESDSSKYTIRYQTDGKFAMPEDSSFYFSFFREVTSIEGLENVDTSNVINMSAMFHFNYCLTSLDLSNFDTSNVTNMSLMFAECSGLTSLDLSSFDTGNVVDMSYMFWEYSSLTNLDLSNFDTSRATSMAYMFAAAPPLPMSETYVSNTSQSISNLDLSSFDTSNVTNMEGMFNMRTEITNLNVSSFNTSKVTNMSQMFAGMDSLTSLDLSNFDTSNVTNMEGMFYVCISLTSLDYGPNFIRKSGSTITDMYGECPANKPTDASWDGAF